MTTIYSVTGLLFDLAGTRSAFRKNNGYCTIEFNTSEDTGFLVLIVQLASIFVMQVVVFAIGIILYLMNKKCSEFSSIDTRVYLTLGSTAGLNNFLLIVVQLAGVDHNIALLSSSIGTCVQMSILLIIFSTSMKVKIAR